MVKTKKSDNSKGWEECGAAEILLLLNNVRNGSIASENFAIQTSTPRSGIT